MNKEMKVSLIMPVYNIASKLDFSIKSVLDQTYKNVELIIVDDGSTDSSSRIIDQYSKHNKNIIAIHRKNGGVFSARMEGVDYATGEFIGFIDGDDYMEPVMIEALINNALYYKADISHCGYKMVFPNGRKYYYYGTQNIVIQDNKKGVIDLIEGKYIEPGLWNKLYKKELFNKIPKDKLDFSIKINEDLLLNYFLFKESKCSVYIDECYYHYQLRPNSAATSKINENKMIDPIKVLNIMLQDNIPIGPYYDYILTRLAWQLISLSIMNSYENSQLICFYKNKARDELKNKLLSILKCRKCKYKIKVMTVLAILFPKTYQLVHLLYEKCAGLDNKYSLIE